MTFAELQQAVAAGQRPPANLAPALQGLWLDALGDWDGAHAAAQAENSRDAAWVHAYLHRKEGDRSNAGYWYSRAGRVMPANHVNLASEWAEIAGEFVGRG